MNILVELEVQGSPNIVVELEVQGSNEYFSRIGGSGFAEYCSRIGGPGFEWQLEIGYNDRNLSSLLPRELLCVTANYEIITHWTTYKLHTSHSRPLQLDRVKIQWRTN